MQLGECPAARFSLPAPHLTFASISRRTNSHPDNYRAGAFEHLLLSALFARSHPQQNYVDYHKCVNAKGEDFPPCQQFKRAYRSLCPSE
jgi:hypothetical protein